MSTLAVENPSRASIEAENTRYRADLADLVGPDSARAVQEFPREFRSWSQSGNLATHLYDTDTPLTSPQGRQLAATLVAAATDANGRLTPTPADWDAVFAQAAGFLSPPQLAVLKTLHEHDVLWSQLNRLRSKAAGGK